MGDAGVLASILHIADRPLPSNCCHPIVVIAIILSLFHCCHPIIVVDVIAVIIVVATAVAVHITVFVIAILAAIVVVFVLAVFDVVVDKVAFLLSCLSCSLVDNLRNSTKAS